MIEEKGVGWAVDPTHNYKDPEMERQKQDLQVSFPHHHHGQSSLRQQPGSLGGRLQGGCSHRDHYRSVLHSVPKPRTSHPAWHGRREPVNVRSRRKAPPLEGRRCKD